MTARAGDAALRREIRAARRKLTPSDREHADAAILRHIRRLPAWHRAKHVALFFAFDGEPDLSPLIRFDQGRQFYAPIIAGDEMHFGRIGRHSRLEANAFGIAEPYPAELIDPRALDLVLTPLVAFDSKGHRVGVGGGFYDRRFEYLIQRRHWMKPKLTGIAYSVQKVDAIRPNSWDVPLWAVVTELGTEKFAR